jgi:hypothetical protein
VTALVRRALRSAFVAMALAAILNFAVHPLVRAAAPKSVEEIALELKASFGDSFQLCVNANDDGSPPAHHNDDDCPLCCLHGAVALFAPTSSPQSVALVVSEAEVPPPADIALPPPARASPAQQRAPPHA